MWYKDLGCILQKWFQKFRVSSMSNIDNTVFKFPCFFSVDIIACNIILCTVLKQLYCHMYMTRWLGLKTSAGTHKHSVLT